MDENPNALEFRRGVKAAQELAHLDDAVSPRKIAPSVLPGARIFPSNLQTCPRSSRGRLPGRGFGLPEEPFSVV